MNSCEGSAVFGFRRFNRNSRSTKIVFCLVGITRRQTCDTAYFGFESFLVSMKGSAEASQELSVLMTVTRRHIRLLAKAAASH